MLNTPNEWHNEEDTEEYADEELSEDEEYDEEYYDEDGDGGDGGDDDGGLRKKLIIASAILFLFLVLVGSLLGAKMMKNKSSTVKQSEAPVAEAPIETTETVDVSEETVPAESTDVSGGEDEVSIEIEVEDQTAAVGGEEGGLSIPVETKTAVADEESGLQVEVQEVPTVLPGKKDDTVTVSIGDIGRKNPFSPSGSVGTKGVNTQVKKDEDGLNFEVIEPPSLAVESEDIAKLLQTKVTGILYDDKKPSAIININGSDQLVKIGDILSGFEIISITHNKVVIRSDNNVYRASVGQPLNAEKIESPVEISNLETKFWGSKGQ